MTFRALVFASALSVFSVPMPVAASDDPHLVQRVWPVGEIAEARLGELAAASTLVREMLALLNASPQISISIRASAILMVQERSGGIARFSVHGPILLGRIEFDTGTRGAAAQRVALAHELAHAVEIAALPSSTTSVLGNRLMAHIGRHAPWSPNTVIETPFARAVDRRVLSELNHGPAAPGTLQAIAKRHQLELP